MCRYTYSIVLCWEISILFIFTTTIKNTNGKIVTIKITERNIFATMHGIIETEKGNDEVKVIFMSGGFNFFSDFNVGDYVDCFIREKDLSNPKFVVLYR